MRKNIFLSLAIVVTIVILNCLIGITLAQGKSITIRIDNREYQVQADGDVLEEDGTTVQDTKVLEKARYTAMVISERITESEYNKVVFAPITRTMIELQSLVKPLSGAYAYVFFSSENIASSLLEGGAVGGPAGAFGNVAKDLTKDVILEVIKELVEHPEKTAMKMANDAYALGLQAYRDNYATYRSVTQEGYTLSYNDAVNFMANERQKEMLGVATQFIRDIRSKKYNIGQYSEDSQKNLEIQQKLLVQIADMKAESLGKKMDIAVFMTKFKSIFEEALSGLENYKPYSDFEASVSSLNNGFSKMEYAYYENIKPSEFYTSDTAEAGWDNSTIQPPPVGPVYASLDNDGVETSRIDAEYIPITKVEGEQILREYKSVPGGVTLEGNASGLVKFSKVRYEISVNAFILDDNSAYVIPVTLQEMKDILLAISKSDKMGVSMAGEYFIYGGLDKENNINLTIRLVDEFLGNIAFGGQHEDKFGDYKFAKGYVPKKFQGTLLSGACVYFRFCDYEFRKNKTLYELASSRLAITLVPTKKEERADDGGALPDFNAIEKGDIPDVWKQNVQHISENVDYYMRERMMRMVNCYGEAAAFARVLKSSGIDLKKLADSI